MTLIIFQSFLVPPPMLNITGFPVDMDFFGGLDLTFTCSITLNETVDTPVTVQTTWNRNGSGLIDDGNRITISDPPMVTPPYKTTVRINSLRTTDAGTYNCITTVTPQNTTFITGTVSMFSQTITVGGSYILAPLFPLS